MPEAFDEFRGVCSGADTGQATSIGLRSLLKTREVSSRTRERRRHAGWMSRCIRLSTIPHLMKWYAY